MAGFVCPHCNGSTWVLDDAGEATPCVCREETLRRARTRGLITTIPHRFAGLAVSDDGQYVTKDGRRLDFPQNITRPVLKYIRTIGDQLAAGRGIWFTGDTGTGKTTLAMLISREALRAGHTVAIYSVPRLLAEIRNTFDQKSDSSYEELFRKLTTVDLLHLDDLGAEQQTNWVLEQLYAIVNERYEDGRALIVTTNLDIPSLQDQIGERTVSRLIEICDDPLPLHGTDRRIESFTPAGDEPLAQRMQSGPAV